MGNLFSGNRNNVAGLTGEQDALRILFLQHFKGDSLKGDALMCEGIRALNKAKSELNQSGRTSEIQARQIQQMRQQDPKTYYQSVGYQTNQGKIQQKYQNYDGESLAIWLLNSVPNWGKYPTATQSSKERILNNAVAFFHKYLVQKYTKNYYWAKNQEPFMNSMKMYPSLLQKIAKDWGKQNYPGASRPPLRNMYPNEKDKSMKQELLEAINKDVEQLEIKQKQQPKQKQQQKQPKQQQQQQQPKQQQQKQQKQQQKQQQQQQQKQ